MSQLLRWVNPGTFYKESSELAPYALLSFLALENYEEHLSDYLERTTIKMNNSN